MKWWPFGSEERHSASNISLDQLIERLDDFNQATSGVKVTPENCMRSPTVHAIVTAVSRRLSVSPLRVMRRSYNSKGREQKEVLPDHPVSSLLSKPNGWQSRTNYWLDAVSVFMRHGNFYAYKSSGVTGPIRYLIPLHPDSVTVGQGDDLLPTYRATYAGRGQQDVPIDKMHHVRGSARDFVVGDSPIYDCREAVALEIALEQFGAAFFGNGALPLMFFTPGEKFKDFATTEARDKFFATLREALTGKRAHSGFWLPKGLETKDVQVENEKTQFIEARKFQRTVIAGAFGVPPHFVGDLERATFNNVEQQDTDFVINVVMPVAQAFETAMERDLLTPADRAQGVIIRFNLDAIQRADFKSRQEGLQVQRRNGVINANEWREAENRNPIDEADGGEKYIVEGNMTPTEKVGETDGAVPGGTADPQGSGTQRPAN